MRAYPLKIITIFACLLLVGCAQNSQPMGKPLPQLSYEHLTPYKAYSGGVEVRQSFKPDATTLKVAAEFPLAPETLLQRYATQRFDRYQRPIKMVFDVQNAALSKKADQENLLGFLSGAAENMYVLNIDIKMSPVQDGGGFSEPFTIALKRELFLPQNFSLAEKEFRQFEFLEQAMNDIDRVVTKFVTERMQ